MAARALYEKCPVCDGSGRSLLYRRAACRTCQGEKYVEIGLTVGQVERLVANERVRLGDPAAVVRTCRACGCTDLDCRKCIERTGRPCHWVERDLCSACVPVGSEVPR